MRFIFLVAFLISLSCESQTHSVLSSTRHSPTSGDPYVIQTESKTIVSGPNWYGRTSMKVKDGITIMAYREADFHHVNDFDQIMVMFSEDYGETWTEPNVYIDDDPVTGMPSFPDAGAADPEGAGEPWLYLMPNGDLVIHMWKSDYGVTNNGTYQIRSTDGGKTWSSPALISFQFEGSTYPNNLNIFSTDDDFVYNGVVYAAAREYQSFDTFDSAIRSWFIKSEDNGVTWELVSLISAYTDVTNEVGLTYVGNNEIVAMVREFVTFGYQTRSYDFGATWGPLVDVTPRLGAMSRQRVNTRAQLQGIANYWDDPVVICVGYVHVNPGNSHPRRAAVWVSKDRGLNWFGPFYMDAAGYDGGYGSVIYNPNTDEYVFTVYFAPLDDTNLNDGIIKQHKFTVNLK